MSDLSCQLEQARAQFADEKSQLNANKTDLTCQIEQARAQLAQLEQQLADERANQVRLE